MSKAMRHEELVELLQEGKIGFLRFVMEGENAQDYLDWCRATVRTRRTSRRSFMSNRRTPRGWTAS